MENTRFRLSVFIVAAVFSLGFFQGLSQEVDSKAYSVMLAGLLDRDVPETDVTELSSSPSTPVLLDARAKGEYKVSHIKNAIWVGYDEFSPSAVKAIDKGEEIVVYCSVGYRSEKITEKLQALGYTNVKNLYGGVFEWVNQGHSVVDQKNAETDKVHAFDKFWGVWLEKGEKVYD